MGRGGGDGRPGRGPEGEGERVGSVPSPRRRPPGDRTDRARSGVGLFRPADCDGGRVALVSARSVAAEPASDAAGFAIAAPPAPADWPGMPDVRLLAPAGRDAGLDLPAGRRRPRAPSRSSRPCRRRSAGRGSTSARNRPVTSGTAASRTWTWRSRPPWKGAGRWRGPTSPGRSRLGPGPDGSTLHRLDLRREATEALRLRFRSRLPIGPLSESDGPRRVEVPRLRFPGVEELPPRVVVTAGAGVVLKPTGAGWSAEVGEGDRPARDWAWSGPIGERPPSRRRPPPCVALPPLVASRLWLRTVRMPEGEAWTSAWYRVEAHQGSLAVALPRRGRVGPRQWSTASPPGGSSASRSRPDIACRFPRRPRRVRSWSAWNTAPRRGLAAGPLSPPTLLDGRAGGADALGGASPLEPRGGGRARRLDRREPLELGRLRLEAPPPQGSRSFVELGRRPGRPAPLARRRRRRAGRRPRLPLRPRRRPLADSPVDRLACRAGRDVLGRDLAVGPGAADGLATGASPAGGGPGAGRRGGGGLPAEPRPSWRCSRRPWARS